MPWFPQMWAAAVPLNGRLLRENALQGAEQLGAEIVRVLNGGLCPLMGPVGACSQGLCLGDWSRCEGNLPQECSIPCPVLSQVPCPSAVPHPGRPGCEAHGPWGLTAGPNS